MSKNRGYSQKSATIWQMFQMKMAKDCSYKVVVCNKLATECITFDVWTYNTNRSIFIGNPELQQCSFLWRNLWIQGPFGNSSMNTEVLKHKVLSQSAINNAFSRL